MGEGNQRASSRSCNAASPASRAGRALGWALLLAAPSACGLDFGVGSRGFSCPPEVSGCIVCNADGSCREPEQAIAPVLMEPGSAMGSAPMSVPGQAPDASVPPEQILGPPLVPPVMGGGAGGAAAAPPDAGAPQPPLDDVCSEYSSRTSDSLCLAGEQQCFSLGSVLSPALVAWLDPTTLPRDGSRYWCDRSGQRHHALLHPEPSSAVVEPDGRAVAEVLARSLLLDGTWLSLSEGTQPALVAGNFAVVLAAAGLPPDTVPADPALPDPALPDTGLPDTVPQPLQPFELFESGERSRINLTLVPSTGRVEGRITSLETALVTAPVVTQSSVYDGVFHLYSLHRRSEVRVLDDVLQLRLNSALEFRGSSIAIPRALDLSSPQPPRLGGRSTAAGVSTTGRGRVAAAILFRGAVPEDELARLEYFLCNALAVCGAPAAAVPPAATAPPLTR